MQLNAAAAAQLYPMLWFGWKWKKKLEWFKNIFANSLNKTTQNYWNLKEKKNT